MNEPKPQKKRNMCHHCGRYKRLPTYRFCNRCKEYLTPLIRIWAKHENPIPGEDVREYLQ